MVNHKDIVRVVSIGGFMVATVIASLAAVPAWAVNQDSLQKQEQVYGWQLMSEQERDEYQQRMREMKTTEEFETYRNRHHEMMQERAQQQGITLPASPGPHSKGIGYGKGGKR